MTAYETLLISKPNLDQTSLEGLKKKVSTAIEKNGGQPIAIDVWGTKRLAYEVKKFREGSYFLFKFHGEKETVRKLEDYLNLQTDIIRYMTTKMIKSAVANLKAKGSAEPKADA